MKNIKLSKIIIGFTLVLTAVICIAPFLLIISTSFSTDEAIKSGYSFIPKQVSVSAYKYVFSNTTQLVSAYGLTIFVTFIGTLFGIIAMTSCAYVISRNDFKLKKFLAFYIYFTMLFSGGTVASYIWIVRYLHLANKSAALILPIMMNAWNIFILRVSCRAVPVSLIESAKIDGARELYIFVNIVVPLAKTGIATIALLTMFTYWNDWFLSMMYMDTARKSTLQYYLVRILNNVEFAKKYASQSGGLANTMELPDEAVRMAICTLAAGPMLCVFPFFQRYFVKGITVGSVKG